MSVPACSQPDGPLKELVVANTLAAAKQPETAILQELAACGFSEEDIFAIKLALEEAMTNAVRHGNRNDPKKHVIVRYAITPARATIVVTDEGVGFTPALVPDPTAPENLERPSGRGIMLMRAYMTHVFYSRSGNEVTLIKENIR